ncbi:MAG TPA: hypothetical protein VKN14_03105 [Flavobacteriaceae bacterium]|nr:hypothetical protein [Flavobacteriaceae bacterium]
MKIDSVLRGVNRRNLTNNTQKVALKLLKANGSWVRRSDLERVATSASARVRDLRKPQFGRFQVECESAATLNRNGSQHTFFYRIRPSTVSKRQVETVFRLEA